MSTRSVREWYPIVGLAIGQHGETDPLPVYLGYWLDRATAVSVFRTLPLSERLVHVQLMRLPAGLRLEFMDRRLNRPRLEQLYGRRPAGYPSLFPALVNFLSDWSTSWLADHGPGWSQEAYVLGIAPETVWHPAQPAAATPAADAPTAPGCSVYGQPPSPN